MSKAKDLQQRIAGKAKQAVGEIIGDQELQDDGKAEAERSVATGDRPNEFNPVKKLNRPT